MDIVEKLLSRIKVNANGCFEWQMYCRPDGYGYIRINGVAHRAHRLSYQTFRRPIPEGMFVCHSCDNRCCINPAHLFLGTVLDNNRDAMRKDRVAFGDRHANSKLDDATVARIVELYNAGQHTQLEIGELIGVCQQEVHWVLSGKIWRRAGAPSVKKRACRIIRGGKLSQNDVREIRRLLEDPQNKPADIAPTFGVSVSTINQIKHRKSWATLDAVA